MLVTLLSLLLSSPAVAGSSVNRSSAAEDCPGTGSRFVRNGGPIFCRIRVGSPRMVVRPKGGAGLNAPTWVCDAPNSSLSADRKDCVTFRRVECEGASNPVAASDQRVIPGTSGTFLDGPSVSGGKASCRYEARVQFHRSDPYCRIVNLIGNVPDPGRQLVYVSGRDRCESRFDGKDAAGSLVCPPGDSHIELIHDFRGNRDACGIGGARVYYTGITLQDGTALTDASFTPVD